MSGSGRRPCRRRGPTHRRDITSAGGTAAPVCFDLAEGDSVRALFDTAAATYGGVDLLFNVGADMSTLRGDTDVVDIDLKIWDRTMTVNLRGYVLSMKHAIPPMLARGGGVIVGMSSAAAFRASLPGRPTRRLSPESVRLQGMSPLDGERGYPLYAVAPGFTATEAIRLYRSGRICSLCAQAHTWHQSRGTEGCRWAVRVPDVR